MFERMLRNLKISMLAGICLATALPAHSALIHQYVFAGNVDDQGTGGVNGTLVGGGATATGGVLQLDGTAWVTFGSYLVPTTGNYSVLLFAQYNYDGNVHEFISQGGSGGPGFYIGPYGNEMRVTDNYNWTATPDFGGGSCGFCTRIAAPLDGNWHHYALVVTGSSAEFFIDGISRGTRGSFGIGAGGNPTILGSQFGGNSELFKGQMSDVRIYDNALTGAQVAAISAEDSGVPEPASVTLLAGALLAMTLRARRSGVARSR